MTRISLFGAVPALVLALWTAPAAAQYLERAEVRTFIDELVAEGLDRGRIEEVLGGARRQEKILEAIARPAEKVLEWREYRGIFVREDRLAQGMAFHREHRDTLRKAAEQTGVPQEMVLAILGIETRYGRQRGSWRVVDALATLGFDYPPRAEFFRGQLAELFRLERRARIDAAALKGSYAGAMGYPQFIPSSYLNYAVDFDDDGTIDLLDNPADAIGSVANYFRAHRWRPGLPVASRARVRGDDWQARVSDKGRPDMTLAEARAAGITPVSCRETEYCFETPLADDTPVALLRLQGSRGAEFWLVTDNFYVITRYNHSVLYAMAAHQLAHAFRERIGNE